MTDPHASARQYNQVFGTIQTRNNELVAGKTKLTYSKLKDPKAGNEILPTVLDLQTKVADFASKESKWMVKLKKEAKSWKLEFMKDYKIQLERFIAEKDSTVLDDGTKKGKRAVKTDPDGTPTPKKAKGEAVKGARLNKVVTEFLKEASIHKDYFQESLDSRGSIYGLKVTIESVQKTDADGNAITDEPTLDLNPLNPSTVTRETEAVKAEEKDDMFT